MGRKPKDITPPRELSNPIAWVCRTYDMAGMTEVQVIREGMSKADIIANFPPDPRWKKEGKEYNRAELIKSIMWEAYIEAMNGQERERQNIRGFWYERLFYTMVRVMGEPGDDDNIKSIQTTINTAWGELVENGYLTYEDLNLYSEKETLYQISVSEDSPYPCVVVMVEKASLFDELRSIADSYGIAFCCTGGQDSRAAAMAYVSKLERLGVDLFNDFTVFSFTDFDPEGWVMPVKFIDHLSLKLKGNINLVRVGVTREQIGQSVIDYQAIPYPLSGSSEKVRQQKRTKYENFARETGGLYITDEQGREVPARVELNIYKPSQVKEQILAALAEHLDGFSYLVRNIKKSIHERYYFAYSRISDEIDEEVDEACQPYYDAIETAKERLDDEESSRNLAEKAAIRDLHAQIDEIEAVIESNNHDIYSAKRSLHDLESRFERWEENEKSRLYEMVIEEAAIPAADDLISKVEQNGGWASFAAEIELDTEDGDKATLVSAGMNNQVYNPTLGYFESRNVQEWIEERIVEAISHIDISPALPYESPEDWVREAIRGDD